jgi:uncharacterized alpha/beta hydrolase family protein
LGRWLPAISILWLAACSNFRHLGTDLEALESTVTVEGEVQVLNDVGKPIQVVAGLVPTDPAEPIVVRRAVRKPVAGPYILRLEPGRYWIAAFEDENEDDAFQDGERGQLLGPMIIKGTRVRGPKIVIEKPFVRGKDLSERPTINSFKFAIGVKADLKDERFGQEPARKGLWQPLLYARENEPGLYFLQPYDPALVPVIFVHGMSGYPQEFKSLIERLDNKRFQPWVFMYPSGYELKTIGKFLHYLVSRVSDERQFQSLCMVAHSMGGLVAREFLNQHQAERPQNTVRALVTINSPLGGMASASWGVRMAPKVVPSWYDIAPDSDFLRDLYKTPLSDAVEYHMLFGFDDSGETDGVVPLLSQLRVEAQGEAEQVRGYRDTHTGALRADAVAAQVLRALDRCAGQKDLSMGAPRPAEPGVAR